MDATTELAATGLATTQLIDSDRRYLVHPLHHPDDHRQPAGRRRGQGRDAAADAGGSEYIDGISPLGPVERQCQQRHGRRRIGRCRRRADAPHRLCLGLPIGKATNERLRCGSPKRSSATPTPNSAAVYFTTAGAESNESAFKFARYYWKVKDRPAKTKIISRIHAYHGVTMAAMSATGMAAYHKMFGPLVPGFIQVPPPYAYRAGKPAIADPGFGAAEAVEQAILAEGAGHRCGG